MLIGNMCIFEVKYILFFKVLIIHFHNIYIYIYVIFKRMFAFLIVYIYN